MALGWTDFISMRWMRIRALYLIIWGLACWATAASADGPPDLEDGYKYYCAGERADSFFESPNAIIVLKLKTETVRDDSRAMLYCVTDHVDTNFVIDRFFKKHDTMIGGAIEFTVPMQIAGKDYSMKISTGGGKDFKQQGKLNRFESSAKVCGMTKEPDSNGLYISSWKQSLGCNQIPFTGYGFVGTGDNNVEVSCFSETGGECLLSYFYRNWTFSSRHIPRELVPHWRELYAKLIAEIEKRVVIYVAPDACIGPVDCDTLSKASTRP